MPGRNCPHGRDAPDCAQCKAESERVNDFLFGPSTQKEARVVEISDAALNALDQYDAQNKALRAEIQRLISNGHQVTQALFEAHQRIAGLEGALKELSGKLYFHRNDFDNTTSYHLDLMYDFAKEAIAATASPDMVTIPREPSAEVRLKMSVALDDWHKAPGRPNLNLPASAMWPVYQVIVRANDTGRTG